MQTRSYLRSISAALTAVGALALVMNVSLAAEDVKSESLDRFLKDVQAHQATAFHVAPHHRPSHERCIAALPLMAAALKDGDEKLKVRVARVINWMYPDSDGMAGVLIEALKDSAAPVREETAIALGNFLPDAESAVPALQAALGDAEAGVRKAAALSLGRLGPNAASAVEALETLYKAVGQPAVQAAALEALVRIQPERANLLVLEALDAQDTEIRIIAARMPSQLRPDLYDGPKLAAALSRMVADTKADIQLRTIAFQTLNAELKDRPEAWTALPPALAIRKIRKSAGDESDLSILYQVLDALKNWPLTQEQITELVRPQIDDNPLRASLLLILSERGKPDIPMATRILEIATTTTDATERNFSIRALLKSPIDRDKVAKLAANCIEKGELDLIPMLGKCGTAAEPYLPILLTSWERANVYNGPIIATAIAKTGAVGVSRLLEIVGNSAPEERRAWAVRGLSAAENPPADAVPMLFKLALADNELAQASRDTLVAWGAVAGPICANALRSHDDKQARTAAGILSRMGIKATPWINDLSQTFLVERTFAGTYPDAAQDALRAIGESAIPKVLEYIGKSNDERRRLAAELLTQMSGEQLAPFVESLEKLSKQFPDEHAVRKALALAYGDANGGRAKALALLSDPNKEVRAMAAAVCYLKAWTGDDVVQALVEAIKLHTSRAIPELERIGTSAKKALPALMDTVLGNDDLDASAAMRAIATIGPRLSDRQVMRDYLKDRKVEHVRAVAWAALKLSKTDLEALLPDIDDALKFAFVLEKSDSAIVEQLTMACLYAGSGWPPSSIKGLMAGPNHPEAVLAAKRAKERYDSEASRHKDITLPAIASRMNYMNGKVDVALLRQMSDTKDVRVLPVFRVIAVWSSDRAMRDEAQRLVASLSRAKAK